MNIWSHLVSALKGEAGETGEAYSEMQTLKLLDNEIRNSDQWLSKSKDALAELMAKQKLSEKSLAAIKEKIAEMENYARQALEKDNEALALEVVESIIPLEAEQQTESNIQSEYADAIGTLQRQIHQAELDLKQLKQQVTTIKATASVQRAQASIVGRSSVSTTAQQALQKMKAQQTEKAAELDARKELTDADRKNELLEKLKDAGIDTTSNQAKSILDRIKAKE